MLDFIIWPLKRWKLLAITTGSVIALMLVLNVISMILPADSPLNFLPDTFRPEVTVRLNSPSESSGISSMVPSALSGMLGSLGQSSNPNLSLVMQLVKSNHLLDTLGEEFGFHKRYKDAPLTNTRLMLQKKLRLSAGEDAAASGMVFVVISFDDTDKDLATRVLKRAIELIESEFKRITLEPVTAKRAFLEDRERVVSVDYGKAKAALADFQAHYGLDLRTQAVNQVQAIARLQQDIYENELKIKASYLGEEDPLVRQLRDQIKEKKRLIAEIKSGAGSFSSSPIVPLDSVPGLMSVYANLEIEARIQNEIYGMIRKELESSKIEEAGQTAIFQIINPLETPEAKFYPKRTQIMVASAFIGLLLGVGLTFILGYLDRKNADPAEGEKMETIHSLLPPFLRKKRR